MNPKKNRRKRIEPIVSKEKVGRNQPCPCGSKKKYKYCCLKVMEEVYK